VKKWLIGAGVLVALGGGYLAIAHLSGGQYPTLGVPGLGGEEQWLRQTTMTFWEDVTFKDFDRAATYHAPEEQDGVDIPYLLERLFLLKPEFLDILDVEIVYVEIDSTGLRARVKCRIRFKDLIKEKVRDQEMILYFHRDSPEDPWFMKLESSLRTLDVDKDKKH
jgi:hypothetical protein